jgi:hypothetical protein
MSLAQDACANTAALGDSGRQRVVINRAAVSLTISDAMLAHVLANGVPTAQVNALCVKSFRLGRVHMRV